MLYIEAIGHNRVLSTPKDLVNDGTRGILKTKAWGLHRDRGGPAINLHLLSNDSALATCSQSHGGLYLFALVKLVTDYALPYISIRQRRKITVGFEKWQSHRWFVRQWGFPIRSESDRHSNDTENDAPDRNTGKRIYSSFCKGFQGWIQPAGLDGWGTTIWDQPTWGGGERSMISTFTVSCSEMGSEVAAIWFQGGISSVILFEYYIWLYKLLHYWKLYRSLDYLDYSIIIY